MSDQSKIRILYDELGFIESHGGVSRLFAEVMRNMPEGFEWKLPMVATTNAYLRESPFNLPSPKQTVHDFIRETLHGHSFCGVLSAYKMIARLMPGRFPSVELENERARKAAQRSGEFDIYHTTTPHPMFNSWKSVVGKKPILATVVDLIPEIIYKSERVRHFRAQLLRDATHVIAITQKTKQDLVNLYHVPTEKISVVYLGYNMKQALTGEPVDLGEKWGLVQNEYVLFVGKRGGYKNFNWMVKALSPLLRGGLKLFCTGAAFDESEEMLFKQLGVRSQIIQSFVSDNEMNALFKNARAFIHPSLYEGFGIPILDAFAAGCPALLANASCFPEVGGDAALYFDPTNAESLLVQLRQLGASSEVRKTLIESGFRRVKNFSWAKCAEETARIYSRC